MKHSRFSNTADALQMLSSANSTGSLWQNGSVARWGFELNSLQTSPDILRTKLEPIFKAHSVPLYVWASNRKRGENDLEINFKSDHDLSTDYDISQFPLTLPASFSFKDLPRQYGSFMKMINSKYIHFILRNSLLLSAFIIVLSEAKRMDCLVDMTATNWFNIWTRTVLLLSTVAFSLHGFVYYTAFSTNNQHFSTHIRMLLDIWLSFIIHGVH